MILNSNYFGLQTLNCIFLSLWVRVGRWNRSLDGRAKGEGGAGMSMGGGGDYK